MSGNALDTNLERAKMSLRRMREEQAHQQLRFAEFKEHLGHFLSAARVAKGWLQKGDPAWWESYAKCLKPADDALFKFMTDQRNEEHHGGGARVEQDVVKISVFEAGMDRGASSLDGRVFHSSPPGTPPPEVGRMANKWKRGGEYVDVLDDCRRYLAILEDAVRAFEARTVVRVAPLAVNFGPFHFYRDAADYLAAAHAVPPSNRYSSVPYFLVCRSLELALKAYCSAKGDTQKSFKAWEGKGHSLASAARRASEKGLGRLVTPSEAELGELTKADEFYSVKGFEYPTTGMLHQLMTGCKGLPDFSTLLGLADRLVPKVERPCLDAAQPVPPR